MTTDSERLRFIDGRPHRMRECAGKFQTMRAALDYLAENGGDAVAATHVGCWRIYDRC